MKYDRSVIAYHGCDEQVANDILDGSSTFHQSTNDYDWLGSGTYFWEYGRDRAARFARDQLARGKIRKPTVLGAVIQLGNCFDLMDTRFTDELGAAYELLRATGQPLPVNAGNTPDLKLRRLDRAVIELCLRNLADRGIVYDTVRCGFVEGDPAFPGSGISRESHIQLAVRTPSCVVGVFKPL